MIVLLIILMIQFLYVYENYDITNIITFKTTLYEKKINR